MICITFVWGKGKKDETSIIYGEYFKFKKRLACFLTSPTLVPIDIKLDYIAKRFLARGTRI